MNEETSIIPVGNGLVRELIKEKLSISLGLLASSDLRTLKALERQYWQRLQDAGIPIQWKTAIRLTFQADVNKCIEFTFSEYAVRLDKQNGLYIKSIVDSAALYDDREPAREIAVPGEWMIAFEAHVTNEQERQVALKRREEENARIEQIVRLKG